MPTIEALRRQRGWTQAELGARCGVTGEHIASLEHGRRRPSATLASLMALVLSEDLATIIFPLSIIIPYLR